MFQATSLEFLHSLKYFEGCGDSNYDTDVFSTFLKIHVIIISQAVITNREVFYRG